MPRANLGADVILDKAVQLADAEGYQEVTMAALARAFGVKVPSLYKHVVSLQVVQTGIAARHGTPQRPTAEGSHGLQRDCGRQTDGGCVSTVCPPSSRAVCGNPAGSRKRNLMDRVGVRMSPVVR